MQVSIDSTSFNLTNDEMRHELKKTEKTNEQDESSYVYAKCSYSINLCPHDKKPIIHQLSIAPERQGYGTKLVSILCYLYPHFNEWKVLSPNNKSTPFLENFSHSSSKRFYHVLRNKKIYFSSQAGVEKTQHNIKIDTTYNSYTYSIIKNGNSYRQKIEYKEGIYQASIEYSFENEIPTIHRISTFCKKQKNQQIVEDFISILNKVYSYVDEWKIIQQKEKNTKYFAIDENKSKKFYVIESFNKKYLDTCIVEVSPPWYRKIIKS